MRAIAATILVAGLVVVCVGPTGASSGVPVAAPSPGRAADAPLLAALPAGARVSYHNGTGQVRFLAGSRSRPLASWASLRSTVPQLGLAPPGRVVPAFGLPAPEVVARAFIARDGRLFGLASQAALTTERVRTLAGGRAFVRFQQLRGGVPVLGGELIVQTDRVGDVITASGELLPDDSAVATTPTLGLDGARSIALDATARDTATPRRSLVAGSRPSLAIADSRLLGGPALPGPRLVWAVDVRQGASVTGHAATSDIPVSRTVYVDATNGAIALTMDQAETGLDRRICDFQNHPRKDFRCNGSFIRTEGEPPVGRGEVDHLYANMKRIYAFYQDRFGRDGLDGDGEPLVATVRYCSLTDCPLHNAFWEWGPQQAAFGQDWASADDMVAHEFTHGVQDHEDRLFYYYQSGAINESLADTFGEFVDLTDGFGDDRDSVRWRLAEDLPYGPLRDMANPPSFGDPDRIRSPLYRTSENDTGGVHYNSGVGNKAVALITDGGTFNGYTIRGLGLTKAALIYYELMTNLLTSASDYNDVYDDLPQACLDLVGSNGIDFDDCLQVRRVVNATEMDLAPAARVPAHAPVCGDGRVPVTTWFDDLEDPGSGAWASSTVHGHTDTWYYPPNPNNDPKWDGTWASSGHLNLFGDDRRYVTDSVIAMTHAVKVPAEGFLRFEHGFRFDFDSRGRFDGGIVEYRVGTGAWRDARPLFVQGGYNGKLRSKHGNPLGGRRAFSGSSFGWGSSRLDISGLAGSKVRFRFRTGTDKEVGSYGWYVDDVRIYRCVVDDQVPTVAVTIAGGDDSTDKDKVNVAVDAQDVGSSVVRLRLSDSPVLKDGILRYAMEMPVQDTVKWPITDPDFGGSTDPGPHQVYAQVQDAAGNWSDVASDDIDYEPAP